MLGRLAALSTIALVAFVGVARAAPSGTPAEAKAMLERVVLAVKADKSRALVMFTKGEGGFKDRDLYPYCGGPDGNFTAHPTLLGRSFKRRGERQRQQQGEDHGGLLKSMISGCAGATSEGDDLGQMGAVWRLRFGGCRRSIAAAGDGGP